MAFLLWVRNKSDFIAVTEKNAVYWTQLLFVQNSVHFSLMKISYRVQFRSLPVCFNNGFKFETRYGADSLLKLSYCRLLYFSGDWFHNFDLWDLIPKLWLLWLLQVQLFIIDFTILLDGIFAESKIFGHFCNWNCYFYVRNATQG